jgi:hypothetical protein
MSSIIKPMLIFIYLLKVNRFGINNWSAWGGSLDIEASADIETNQNVE